MIRSYHIQQWHDVIGGLVSPLGRVFQLFSIFPIRFFFQANERKVVSIQADDPIAFMQLLETAENEILEVSVDTV